MLKGNKTYAQSQHKSHDLSTIRGRVLYDLHRRRESGFLTKKINSIQNFIQIPLLYAKYYLQDKNFGFVKDEVSFKLNILDFAPWFNTAGYAALAIGVSHEPKVGIFLCICTLIVQMAGMMKFDDDVVRAHIKKQTYADAKKRILARVDISQHHDIIDAYRNYINSKMWYWAITLSACANIIALTVIAYRIITGDPRPLL